jgi:DNA-3-methyladenine glycosylase
VLGARLVHETEEGRRVGRIVELEAYIGTDDLASHARFGPTARNAVMFGPPGRAYVYLVYGMYTCLNLVTEPDGSPAALLVRAVEPLAGVELMRAERVAWTRPRRSRSSVADSPDQAGRPVQDLRLASGPGLLCVAFGIDRGDSGRDLCDPASSLRLELPARGDRPVDLRRSARIGIGYAALPWRDQPWRLLDASSPSVSGVQRTRPSHSA